MSTDVRALLKAKTQERAKRIVHPLAAYNASGQLRCTLCATIVKDNEISWSGHLGSKSHRTNVGRQKELAKNEEERARLEKGKRKAVGSGHHQEGSGSHDEDEDMDVDHLRTGQGNVAASKRQKTEEEQRPSAALSSNFFSDPTRSLPTGNDDEDDEAQENRPSTRTKSTGVPLPNALAKPSQIDLEWAQFERDVLAKPTLSTLNPDDPPLSKKEIYDRATVVMEEQVRYTSNGDGFPDHLQTNPAGTASREGGGTVVEGEYVGGVPIEDESPEQAAARKAQEEKELIMDRILDEERAQEDADEKVRSMKARLALVKKRREEEKKKKAAAAEGGS